MGKNIKDLITELEDNLNKLIMVLPLLSEDEREKVVAELEKTLTYIQEQQKREARQKPRKKGLLTSIVEKMRRNYLLNTMPQLVAATPELPSELVHMYLETLHGGYSPLAEAAIRQLLLEIKTSYPDKYAKLEKLFKAGLPWSIWAVATLDRVANGRNIPLNLQKLWAMFIAATTRDPFYIISRLGRERPELADKLYQLVQRSEEGDEEAAKKLREVLAVAYSVPPSKLASYDILYPEKIEELEKMLSPQPVQKPQSHKPPAPNEEGLVESVKPRMEELPNEEGKEILRNVIKPGKRPRIEELPA